MGLVENGSHCESAAYNAWLKRTRYIGAAPSSHRFTLPVMANGGRHEIRPIGRVSPLRHRRLRCGSVTWHGNKGRDY